MNRRVWNLGIVHCLSLKGKHNVSGAEFLQVEVERGKENELWLACYKNFNPTTAVALHHHQNYFNEMLPSFVYLWIHFFVY
jgi:hypothetical protein